MQDEGHALPWGPSQTWSHWFPIPNLSLNLGPRVVWGHTIHKAFFTKGEWPSHQRHGFKELARLCHAFFPPLDLTNIPRDQNQPDRTAGNIPLGHPETSLFSGSLAPVDAQAAAQMGQCQV